MLGVLFGSLQTKHVTGSRPAKARVLSKNHEFSNRLGRAGGLREGKEGMFCSKEDM